MSPPAPQIPERAAEARPPDSGGRARGKLPGGRWLWRLTLGLLAVNFAVATRIPSGHPRVAVPVEPIRRGDGTRHHAHDMGLLVRLGGDASCAAPARSAA